MPDDHLKMRQIMPDQFQRIEPPPNIQMTNMTSEKTKNCTRWLWVIGSWTIILLNTFVALIVVRDMYNGAYNAANHYFMTTAFVVTIGALGAIHTWILNKDARQ